MISMTASDRTPSPHSSRKLHCTVVARGWPPPRRGAACPRLGPFLRQVVALAARRGLACAVNETYRTFPVAPLLVLVPAVRVVGPAAAQAYLLAFPALPAAVVP